jgi:hypothetical protein
MRSWRAPILAMAIRLDRTVETGQEARSIEIERSAR